MINVKKSLRHAFEEYSLTQEAVRCARVLTDTDEEIVVSLPEKFTNNEYASFWEDIDFGIPEHELIGCVWLLDGKWLAYQYEELEWVLYMTPIIPPALRREN
jgi:hypothetical protein